MSASVEDLAQPMRAAERRDLIQLVRLRAKVARDDAEARGRALLADAEIKLSAVFSAEDAVWKDLTDLADARVAELDTELAKRPQARGIPASFRPRINCYWVGRGENAVASRRAELRKVAQTRVAAMVAPARVEIDRHTTYQLTELTAGSLTTAEAQAFLGEMPSSEDLLPELGHIELASGELIALDAPVTDVTALPVTDVTTNDGPVTGRPCGHCGQAFVAERSDGRYCSAACRVAAHRARVRMRRA